MSLGFTALLRTVGIAIYHLRLHHLVRWLNRRHVRVLLYHACEPEESDFTRGLQSNTKPENFAMHLECVRRYYQPIAVDDISGERAPDYAIAITFDDGYDSVRRHAAPLLSARELPATVYLISDVVDNRGLVWVNAINWLFRTREPAVRGLVADEFPETRHLPVEDIIQLLRGAYDVRRMTKLLATLFEAVGVQPHEVAQSHQLYLSTDSIGVLATQGFTFGNHTASHPSLGRLSYEEQHEELQRAEHALRELPGWRQSLAYPFGDFSAQSVDAARSLHYTTVMEVGGDPGAGDPHHVCRVPVTATTPAAFFAEVEVVTPVKGLLKRWLRRDVRRGTGHSRLV